MQMILHELKAVQPTNVGSSLFVAKPRRPHRTLSVATDAVRDG